MIISFLKSTFSNIFLFTLFQDMHLGLHLNSSVDIDRICDWRKEDIGPNVVFEGLLKVLEKKWIACYHTVIVLHSNNCRTTLKANRMRHSFSAWRSKCYVKVFGVFQMRTVNLRGVCSLRKRHSEF